MSEQRVVKLFKNGSNWALRIPREFEFPGDEAILRKEANCLVIEPIEKRTLVEVLATLEPLEEDFPEIPDLPPEPVEF